MWGPQSKRRDAKYGVEGPEGDVLGAGVVVCGYGESDSCVGLSRKVGGGRFSLIGERGELLARVRAERILLGIRGELHVGRDLVSRFGCFFPGK